MERLHSKPYRWTPFQVFEDVTDMKLALLILNRPINCWETLMMLWKKAVLKIAVDGGSNSLYRACSIKNYQDKYLPDIISGDFDSIKPDVLKFYQNKGVKIVRTPDQDHTDFTKALRLSVANLHERSEVSAIAVLVEAGGRLDQTLSNLHSLYLAQNFCSVPVYLITSTTITWLLHSGNHCLSIPRPLMRGQCGLIPLGEPCHNVTTTGLKWNLENQSMQFGGLVSTSNTFTHDFVTIETDKPLIFTMDRILHHVDDDYSATNGFFVRENSDTIGEQDSEL